MADSPTMTTPERPASPVPPFDLAGKVAVITGGSRGIGRAIAEGLARAGADVVIASRKLEACEATVAELEKATGRRALPVQFHVGRWEDSERLVDAVYGEFGRCDVLVNNAGMSPAYGDLTSVTEELYDKVHTVNAKGPFRLSVLVGTRMAASAGGGSIINVSSVGSWRPTPVDLPYGMAKAALNALTLALAGAWAPKVRANLVLPSATETDLDCGMATRDQVPHRRHQPDEAPRAVPRTSPASASSWRARPPATSTVRKSPSTVGCTGRSDRPSRSPTVACVAVSRSVTVLGNMKGAEIPRGGYVFLSWIGDHGPRHVHVYRDGRLVVKWDLDNHLAMKGQMTARIRRLIEELVEEGKL